MLLSVECILYMVFSFAEKKKNAAKQGNPILDGEYIFCNKVSQGDNVGHCIILFFLANRTLSFYQTGG